MMTKNNTGPKYIMVCILLLSDIQKFCSTYKYFSKLENMLNIIQHFLYSSYSPKLLSIIKMLQYENTFQGKRDIHNDSKCSQ